MERRRIIPPGEGSDLLTSAEKEAGIKKADLPEIPRQGSADEDFIGLVHRMQREHPEALKALEGYTRNGTVIDAANAELLRANGLLTDEYPDGLYPGEKEYFRTDPEDRMQ